MRYIVPQYIRVGNANAEIQLFMRADNQYTNKSFVVEVNGQIIHKVKKPFITPSAMESMHISLTDVHLQENTTLCVSLAEEV